MPKGPGCKACIGTWLAGGWQDEYSTPEKYQEDVKKDSALHPEFMDSRAEFIQMHNRGEIPIKVRRCAAEYLGIKRNAWQRRLQEKRKHRRRLLRATGRRVGIKGNLKAQTPVRYAQTHQGRTPAMDGLVPKKRKIKGVPTLCV